VVLRLLLRGGAVRRGGTLWRSDNPQFGGIDINGNAVNALLQRSLVGIASDTLQLLAAGEAQIGALLRDIISDERLKTAVASFEYDFSDEPDGKASPNRA